MWRRGEAFDRLTASKLAGYTGDWEIGLLFGRECYLWLGDGATALGLGAGASLKFQ
jgi:hypothetical protein